MKNGMLAAMALAAGLITGSAYADLNFTVDSGATQNAYVNAFNVSDDGYATGFAYDPALSPSTFAGAVQTLGLNTDIYTANGGGTGAEDPFWFTGDGSGTQLKYVEVNTYQETAGVAAGTTVNFDFTVLANDISTAGYDTQGFIKVLDPNAGYATTQSIFSDLSTLGAAHLTLDTAASGVIVQAGFYVKGLYVDPTTAANYEGVKVIPEPASIALIGMAGGALLFFRRNFKV